jgi:hypothetical protein
VISNVFGSQAADRVLPAAIKKRYDALKYPEFRSWLEKHATSGIQMASQSLEKRHAGRADEFKALIKALGRL